jgi:hypothetical protein
MNPTCKFYEARERHIHRPRRQFLYGIRPHTNMSKNKHGWSHFRILLHFYYISMDDTERHKLHRLITGKACYLDYNFHSSLISLPQISLEMVNNIPPADIGNTMKFHTV